MGFNGELFFIIATTLVCRHNYRVSQQVKLITRLHCDLLLKSSVYSLMNFMHETRKKQPPRRYFFHISSLFFSVWHYFTQQRKELLYFVTAAAAAAQCIMPMAILTMCRVLTPNFMAQSLFSPKAKVVLQPLALEDSPNLKSEFTKNHKNTTSIKIIIQAPLEEERKRRHSG